MRLQPAALPAARFHLSNNVSFGGITFLIKFWEIKLLFLSLVSNRRHLQAGDDWRGQAGGSPPRASGGRGDPARLRPRPPQGPFPSGRRGPPAPALPLSALSPLATGPLKNSSPASGPCPPVPRFPSGAGPRAGRREAARRAGVGGGVSAARNVRPRNGRRLYSAAVTGTRWRRWASSEWRWSWGCGAPLRRRRAPRGGGSDRALLRGAAAGGSTGAAAEGGRRCGPASGRGELWQNPRPGPQEGARSARPAGVYRGALLRWPEFKTVFIKNNQNPKLWEGIGGCGRGVVWALRE